MSSFGLPCKCSERVSNHKQRTTKWQNLILPGMFFRTSTAPPRCITLSISTAHIPGRLLIGSLPLWKFTVGFPGSSGRTSQPIRMPGSRMMATFKGEG